MKKGYRLNRRGYFFLLDSIIALTVLVIGAFLVFSSYSKPQSKKEVEVLSEDVMDFFSSNKIKDVNNPYVRVGGDLWSQGLITNKEHTLLQQLGQFYATDNADIAEKFVINLTQDLLPAQYNFELWIDETLIYPRGLDAAHNNSKNSTKVLIPSRKIVHGFLSEETGDLFGPYDTEVLVWQK